MMTAALVSLYQYIKVYDKWAVDRAEKIAHPESYVIVQGFADHDDAKKEGFRIAAIDANPRFRQFRPKLVDWDPEPYRDEESEKGQ